MNGWKKWILIVIGCLGLMGTVVAHEIKQVEQSTENKEGRIANTTRIVAVEKAVKEIPKTNERLARIEGKLDLLLRNRGLIK